jgi:uncharacterized protein
VNAPQPGPSPALALFARRPIPGQAKTRLTSLLSAAGAADFQAALIEDSLGKLARLRRRAKGYVFLSGAPSGTRSTNPWRPDFCGAIHEQRGRTFGERLACAFDWLLARHGEAVVIGADSPQLALGRIRLALAEVARSDAVLGPCPDGGFYLIGLNRRVLTENAPRDLFRKVRWGGRYAFRDTLDTLLARGSVVSVLEPCADVDRPGDFRRLARRFSGRRELRRLSPAVWRFLKARKRKHAAGVERAENHRFK